MVIKNVTKMKCLSISYAKICLPCLEKLSKDLNEFNNYLQGIHIIAILENTSKNLISVILWKTIVTRFHISKFGCSKATTLPKKDSTTLFSLKFSEHFQNEQLLVNSSKHIKEES